MDLSGLKIVNKMNKIYTVLKIVQEERYFNEAEVSIELATLDEDKAISVYSEYLRYNREYSEWKNQRQKAYEVQQSKSNTPTLLVSIYDIFNPNHYNDYVNNGGVSMKGMNKKFIKEYNKSNPFSTTAIDYGEYTRFEDSPRTLVTLVM